MTTKEKEELRKLAEEKFKELGFANHDWGNFLSGFIAGVEHAVRKVENEN